MASAREARGRLCAGAREGAEELPATVLLAYFLVAWMESFPLLAYKALMVDELKMTLPTISNFYAVTFLPWMWKPVYGWLSDSCPMFGLHRVPYICLSATGCALSQLLIALLVSSAAHLFAVYFFYATCSAMLQLMVGTFLVDLASKGRSPAALQGAANAAQWGGTLCAQLAALCAYSGGPGSAAIGARGAIALGGTAPLLLAVLGPLMPETRRTVPQERASWLVAWPKPEAGRLAAMVAIVQANLVLVGCRQLMAFGTWWRAVACAAPASALAVGGLYAATVAARRRSPSGGLLLAEGEGDPHGDALRWPRLCLFCFLVPMLPSSSVAVDQLQFARFTAGSYQALGILASLSSLAASAAFAGSFAAKSVRYAFVASTLLSVILGLAPLPFAMAAAGGGQREGLNSLAGAWGIAATVVGSFGGMWTVLPMDTMITAACAGVTSERRSLVYAMLLSCYNFGGTVGGLAAAPVLEALGLGGGSGSWGSLPGWVAATASLKLLVLVFLPLATWGRRSAAPAEEVAEAPAPPEPLEGGGCQLQDSTAAPLGAGHGPWC